MGWRLHVFPDVGQDGDELVDLIGRHGDRVSGMRLGKMQPRAPNRDVDAGAAAKDLAIEKGIDDR